MFGVSNSKHCLALFSYDPYLFDQDMVKAMPRQSQGKVKARSRQVQDKVKTKSKQGQDKVKERFRKMSVQERLLPSI